MEGMVIRGYRYMGFKTCISTPNICETVKLKVIPRLCINKNGRGESKKSNINSKHTSSSDNNNFLL